MTSKESVAGSAAAQRKDTDMSLSPASVPKRKQRGTSGSPQVSAPAVDADDDMVGAPSRYKLLHKYEDKVAALKKALSDERHGKKMIVDEIAFLRTENHDLKVRIAKLETGVESLIYERVTGLEVALRERDACIEDQSQKLSKMQEFREKVTTQMLK